MAANRVQLQVDCKELAEGASFREVGAYERLVGKAEFAVDPNDPRLAYIVDLDLAPRNADGLVEWQADLDILKPVDPSRGNRRLFCEASNRGGRAVLRMFNDAGGRGGEAGSGFLMRRGYTVVWCGWQGDLESVGGNVVAYLP